VKPLVTIGDGAIIGGGSVVTKDVPAHEVWAGNPARYMKLAWTHPQMRGFNGRAAVKPQYAMTDDEWETARDTAEHRRQESEEVWALQQPYHYREATG
jgi:acyl-[acyl carrier protein]--UDP-N-acetylglucosamine O-acyltransferase